VDDARARRVLGAVQRELSVGRELIVERATRGAAATPVATRRAPPRAGRERPLMPPLCRPIERPPARRPLLVDVLPAAAWDAVARRDNLRRFRRMTPQAL